MAAQLRPRALQGTAFSVASTSASAAAIPTAPIAAPLQPKRRTRRFSSVQAIPSLPIIGGARSRSALNHPSHRERQCRSQLVPPTAAVPIMSTQSSDDDSSFSAGGPELEPKPTKKFSHRWQVVGMMALAFVLCNMDKVRVEGGSK